MRGTLKRLPKDHKIWLLTQHEVDRRVWLQGFRAVKYHNDTGEWQPWINGTYRSRAKIIAVVAPPTSDDIFTYFQKQGEATRSFGPLKGLPAECRNRVELFVDLQP